MKLTNNLRASEYELKDNALYDQFYADIHKIVYATTPDFERGKYFFDISQKKWDINIDKNDEKFYAENYFPVITIKSTNSTNSSGTNQAIQYEIPAKYKHCVGVAENEILTFIYNGGNRLLLIGKEGWGKTTLLRFISHLIPNLKNIERDCVPIYFSFNKRINDLSVNIKELTEVQRQDRYNNILYDEILLNAIRYFTKSMLQSDLSSPFYKTILNEPQFSNEIMEFEDIYKQANNGWITSIDRDIQWNNLRKKISNKKETVLWSFAYLIKNSVIPLLIFDDLDPLNIEFHKYLYNETFYLAHNYKIKIILSIRPRINERLERFTQGAVRINTRIYLDFPNIVQYLKGKDNRISKVVSEMKKKEIILDNGSKIIPNDIEKFFRNYLQILLYSDTRNFIKNISGGNMRVCNELIHVFIRSGFVNSDELITKIINYNKNRTFLLPLWIVYSSIITHNHYTVFGQYTLKDITSHKVHLVNILCNGNENLNPLLLRLHLLSMFVRNNNNHFVEQVKEKYKKIISECNEIIFDRSINRVLQRFNNGGLISSPTCGFIENYEDVKPNDEFRKEELGEYYIKDILEIFEYLSFMKDDTDFGNNRKEIQSCIQVKGHINRFTEVIKYLQYLYEEEIAFYINLKNLEPERMVIYK